MLSTVKPTLEESHFAMIQNKALFATVNHSEKAIRNMKQITYEASPSNPVASCKIITKGKYAQEHFSNNAYIPPKYTLLTKGLPVMLQGTNYHNPWGIYDGARGIVEEIVFSKKHNPNNDNLPLYDVVEFQFYKGPVWDYNNPKVCTNS